MNRRHDHPGLEVHVEIRAAGARDTSRFTHQFTSPHIVPSSLFSAAPVVVPVPTDGAHSGTMHPAESSRPISVRRDVWAIGNSLSDRDWAILRSVAEHRFLTIGHIFELYFADLKPESGRRITQRAVARLRSLRILGAFAQQKGGTRRGSDGMVHYVDTNGERLLRAETGKPVRRHLTDPTETFLRHTLACADAHLSLVRAHRSDQLELITCEVEPRAWRRYIGAGGARLTLKPDLYAETATSQDSDYLEGWFIEIDRGTETIPRLLKKCRDYEAYRRTGIEQERSEGAFPRIVWSMTASDPAKAERRRVALREAIDRDRNLPSELFHIIAPDELIDRMRQGGDE